jgi:catechol 2,3-dioxygenase-like lactoylglutathione lyase family enzyme
MSVPAHLSLVSLAVGDVERATAFYERLGWIRLGGAEGEISFFSLGGPPMLALYDAAMLARDVGRPVGAPGATSTLAINVGSRATVDRVYGEWIAAGATVVAPPEPTDWGGYSSYVADPDGHLWEIAHNPMSPEWAAPGTE